ncbi:MAG: DUF58 domain-containing protein [Thermoplasmata archaeon]
MTWSARDEETHARPAFRPRAFLLYASGGVLVVLALALLNPVPLFLALPLLLAPVAAFLEAPSGEAPATLRWTESGSGANVEVRGEIVLPPTVDARAVHVRFYPAEPLSTSRRPTVRPRAGAVEFSATFHAPFPCLLPLARPDVAWEDPLGLVELPLPLTGPALRIERFPPEVARIGGAHLRRTTSSPGEIRSRTIGSSGEFFAVRAAGPGDTARQINWWATARSGRLLANDYQLERTGDLLVLLDLRPTSLGSQRDAQLLSITRAAALGIADAFLSAKSRVGLGLYGEFLTPVALGTGRVQRRRIAVALQRAGPVETPGPPERLAVSLRRYFPAGITTLLLSTLVDEGSITVLPHLRRRGYPTFVLSPSPIPLMSPTDSPTTADDATALRLLRLARRQRLGAAWAEAPVVEWEDYWSLAPLVNYLKSPARAWRVA